MYKHVSSCSEIYIKQQLNKTNKLRRKIYKKEIIVCYISLEIVCPKNRIKIKFGLIAQPYWRREGTAGAASPSW